MDERLMSECITRAVEGHCAHLRADPLLAQKVIRAAERKEPVIVKKKMSVSLVLALILMLLTATAVAAVLLSGMELINQEAIPLAQGNDGEVRPVEDYTYEELNALILTAQENGIHLDDDTSVMRALRNGEGYSEEETIMAICREAFGGLIYEWTVEERYFFGEKMVEIGWSTENNYVLPRDTEMPSADARALAKQTIWENYGADIPLDDPAYYRDMEDYYPSSGENGSIGSWVFTWTPATLEGNTYHVHMDAQGEWVEHHMVSGFTWEDYDEVTLTRRIDDTYNYRKAGSGMASWEYDAWHAFGQKLPGAKHSGDWDEEYDAYAASVYLLPGENDLTKQQAREIAFADAGVKDYTGVVEILLGKGSQRIWKISFNTAEKTGRNQILSYEIDSASREILRKDDLTNEKSWARYMLFQTYEAFAPDKEDTLSVDEAIDVAVKMLHDHFDDDTIPYKDESVYQIDARYNGYTGDYTVIFNVKQLGYGRANVTVRADGTTDLVFANPGGLNGDTLFDCYADVYGSCFQWDQSRWVEFGQEMQKYEPTTFEGKLFKQTTYVDASTVKITLDDALDILWKETQSDHTCAILIGSEPNPVWKVRINTWPVTTLFEVDAMTGEIVDRELYYIQMPNFDHNMKMYTLHRDYMPAALAEFGVERIAMELCVKTFPDEFEQYGDSPDVFTDKNRYVATVDGMTVTFAAYLPSDPSYRVTVAGDGMSAQVEKLSNAEALENTEPDLAAVYAEYGENHRYWPLEVQQKYMSHLGSYSLPEEGEMTYEEALAHAKQLVIQDIGEHAFDDLGDYVTGCHLLRYENEGEMTAWYFYFTDDPATEENGWRVTFFLRDDVLTGTYQVQHVSSYGNG